MGYLNLEKKVVCLLNSLFYSNFAFSFRKKLNEIKIISDKILCTSVWAVSYTHLDVYKRQVPS